MTVLPTTALVDPLLGIVRRLVAGEPVPGAPRAYTSVTAEVSDARRLGAWPADRVSLGTTFGDVEGARAAAVGEAVERYCGNRVPPGVRYATAAELAAEGRAHLGPGDLPFFAPWQHGEPGWPFRPFTDDLPIAWAVGTEDDTEDGPGDGTGECLVPASWVYLNHHTGARRRESRLHALNYAGIATGTDADDALRRGLLELVERDALELWWHLGGPTRGIDTDAVPGLAAALAGTRLAVHLVELPTELPVACVAAVVVDAETGIVGGGGAARFDAAEAATKAVLEAVHTWVFTQGLLDPDGWVFAAIRAGVLAEGLYLPHRADRRHLDDAGPRFAAVRDLGAQVQIWLDPRVQQAHLPRFTEPAERVAPLEGPMGDLAALRAALARTGSRVVHVDLTTPDVAQTPLRVVRACATRLVPNAPAAFRYLGLPRWREAATARGWAPDADPTAGPDGLTLVPPPFL